MSHTREALVIEPDRMRVSRTTRGVERCVCC
jgi:hypothetical protein